MVGAPLKAGLKAYLGTNVRALAYTNFSVQAVNGEDISPSIPSISHCLFNTPELLCLESLDCLKLIWLCESAIRVPKGYAPADDMMYGIYVNP